MYAFMCVYIVAQMLLMLNWCSFRSIMSMVFFHVQFHPCTRIFFSSSHTTALILYRFVLWVFTTWLGYYIHKLWNFVSKYHKIFLLHAYLFWISSVLLSSYSKAVAGLRGGAWGGIGLSCYCNFVGHFQSCVLICTYATISNPILWTIIIYWKLSSSILSISLGTWAPSVDKSKIATGYTRIGCIYM